ncbi:MAG: RagB/SusD family nutrient uptake outer membrane protein [Flavobacteriaceae bacterium]|nr:RagB/SusD family nutrient uptake outer membrane protein [Flavobacteriaceae bacterium]
MKNLKHITTMKKFNFILIISFLTLAGCANFLEEEPESFLSPSEFFNSEENIDIAVTGVYDVLGNRGFRIGVNFGNYNQGLLSMGTVGTDQMKAPADRAGNRFHQMDMFVYGPSSQLPSNVWIAHYIGVNRANTVINRTEPLLGNPDFDDNKLNTSIAEAKFLRAFYYFNLVRFYGDIPLKLTETQSLTAEDVVSIARSPVVDIYNQIEKDLLFAEQYLKMPSEVANSDNGRATKTAAWALLARVYNTWASYPIKDQSKWELAANSAKRVIDSGEHMLMDEFSSVFMKEFEGNRELIFVAKFSNVLGETSSLGAHNGILGVGGANAFSPNSTAGFGVVRIERSYYESFDELDQRRDWSCSAFRVDKDNNQIPLTDGQLNGAIGMAKFRSDASWVGFGSPDDYPLIRYADVLTMYAEATAMSNGGPTSESYEALNKVRRRAFRLPIDDPAPLIDYVGLSPSEFIDALLQERSWELVSEDCSRWHDLVRTEQLGKFVVAVKRASVVANFNESTHKLFPIPIVEIDVNPLMVQNPGY